MEADIVLAHIASVDPEQTLQRHSSLFNTAGWNSANIPHDSLNVLECLSENSWHSRANVHILISERISKTVYRAGSGGGSFLNKAFDLEY